MLIKFIKRVIDGINYRLFAKKLPRDFFVVRHTKVYYAHQWKSNTNDRLLDLILAAAPIARAISHADIAARMARPPYTPEFWPGEKFKLLTAMVAVLKPKLVIEIGTWSGLSVLALKKNLPPGSKVITFDTRPWQTIDETALREEDFKDGLLVQYHDDLADKAAFAKHAPLLREADLIFIDVGADEFRREEKAFLANFENLDFTGKPIFILNDIRLDAMVDIWLNIDRPKLDVTTFGHWSGNGIIDWKG